MGGAAAVVSAIVVAIAVLAASSSRYRSPALTAAGGGRISGARSRVVQWPPPISAGGRRMHGLETSLQDRVRHLLVTHKGQEIRSTTGLNVTVHELVQRTQALELALTELAAELDKVRAAAHH